MSESEDHIRKKFEVWIKLKKNGYSVWCEPIFKSGVRMDLLAFKEGIFTNYEILENETIAELTEKIKKYPNIEVVPIRTEKDIKELNL